MLFLASCSGTPAARNLSRETLAQVVEYENEIRTLSRDLQDAFDQSALSTRRDIERSAENLEGDIVNNLANDAADRTVRDGFSDRDLRNFAAGILEENEKAEASINVLRLKQIDAHQAAIASTSLDETELQAVRAKLEQLQREPSLSDRAEQIRPLIEAAAATLQTINSTKGP
jgi:dGTP triphosphohydrolase